MRELSKEPFTIRQASSEDASAVLRLFDQVIEWFVSIGNEGQWGTEPWSSDPRQIARVTEACELPEAWVAVHPEIEVCGFIALGEAMPYVPTTDQPELYVRTLVASRDARARGIGRSLMQFADERAAKAGMKQLRVDCYAGGSGALVRFYEACGYQRLSTFNEDDWPGQVLVRHLV